MSQALKARNALNRRKSNYLDWLDSLGDDSIAAEISRLECVSARPGTFDAWALKQATGELDHRL